MSAPSKLSRFDRTIIWTHADGTPIEGRPDDVGPPDHAAGIEAKIAWLRAWHAYHDRVGDVANAAFAEQFTKTVKGR